MRMLGCPAGSGRWEESDRCRDSERWEAKAAAAAAAAVCCGEGPWGSGCRAAAWKAEIGTAEVFGCCA
jgi:hypothetical protein